MARTAVYSIILALGCTVTLTGTARSATVPGNGKTAHSPGASNRTVATYHLATLPSTNKKRVDAMCLRFLSLLPKAKLIPRTEDRTVFRLVVGTFDRLDAAKKRKSELAALGIAAFVAVDEPGYSVVAGSHFTAELALEEQQLLTGKNVTSSIRELRLPLKEWQMRSTESFPLRDAVIMAGKMTMVGVTTTLEPAAD